MMDDDSDVPLIHSLIFLSSSIQLHSRGAQVFPHQHGLVCPAQVRPVHLRRSGRNCQRRGGGSDSRQQQQYQQKHSAKHHQLCEYCPRWLALFELRWLTFYILRAEHASTCIPSLQVFKFSFIPFSFQPQNRVVPGLPSWIDFQPLKSRRSTWMAAIRTSASALPRKQKGEEPLLESLKR